MMRPVLWQPRPASTRSFEPAAVIVPFWPLIPPILTIASEGRSDHGGFQAHVNRTAPLLTLPGVLRGGRTKSGNTTVPRAQSGPTWRAAERIEFSPGTLAPKHIADARMRTSTAVA